jgi:hypothetical protein
MGEELLVLSEEYGNWEDSNRRIDLLCLDKQGSLVLPLRHNGLHSNG